MLWARALSVWLLIIATETVNGVLRTLFVAPWLGDLRARQAALPVAAGLIFLITLACSRWLNAASTRAQLGVGLLWAALTVVFEVIIGFAQGFGPERIVEDYDPTRGGFMAFGLAFMALCPWLAVQVRRWHQNEAGQA